MQTKVDDHIESVSSVQPRQTSFITSREKCIRHDQESLYSSDLAFVELLAQELHESLSIHQSRSVDVVWIRADFRPEAVFGDNKKNRIEK